jgi:predicted nucleic acid-binding protein
MRIEILLDSVILIDHFNQVYQATAYLKQVRDIAAISVITRAEVLTGFDPASRIIAADFLDFFPAFEIDKNIADLGAKLRYDYKWKLPDALQAAVATYYNLKLATRNSKDFPPKKYAFVSVPYIL